MIGRAFYVACQVVIVLMLAGAAALAISYGAVDRQSCVATRFDVANPERDITLSCAAADATTTAYIMVGDATATPCDLWADENVTPLPTRGVRLMAPCSVVAHNATGVAYAATVTAGIIDGSHYGLHIQNSAPYWTPTIYPYGTVPPEVLAGYPLTLTAIPWGTPHGWCLQEDRWVTTCGSRP